MEKATRRKREVDKAADIIRDAGGKIVGRTRLQKVGYLLELAGLGDGFAFEYRHYGPYSEALATAMRDACALDVVREEEHLASWGGYYSIFTTASGIGGGSEIRREFIRLASEADPIELELAATAAFLATEGSIDPWRETAKRKPDKSDDGRLENARVLYRRLLEVKTPRPLPNIA